MKVVLIATPIMDFAHGAEGGPLVPTAMDQLRVCPPYGVYLLAGTLRDAGHEVVVADLVADGGLDLGAYEDHLADASLVGVSSTSLAWSAARHVVEWLKDHRPDLPVVVGGVHGSRFDDYVLSRTRADYVVRGEGEVALLRLVEALERGGDVSTVPALSWREHGAVRRTPEGPRITKEQLGEGPLPDYGQLPRGVYHAISIESSRGCAFDCSFCSTSYRRSYRAIAPEPFVRRLFELLPYAERGKGGAIQIVDDEFCLNPKRAIETAAVLTREGYPGQLIYDARANDLLREGLLDGLTPFTRMLLIGAECGYDEGLRRIGKGVTCSTLEEAARRLATFGIADRALFSFILGLPWETKAEVQQTLRFALRLHETYGVRLLLQWYVLIPGSNLWDEARAKQVVGPAMYDAFGFLRDLYAFRAAVPLAPRDVWEVVREARQAQAAARKRLGLRDDSMVQFGVPSAIAINFPEDTLPPLERDAPRSLPVASPA